MGAAKLSNARVGKVFVIKSEIEKLFQGQLQDLRWSRSGKQILARSQKCLFFSPETFLAVESVVWIVIEKSSDAPYYCHPAETESFRKRSESHPPTITGLTLPDPRITAPPQSRTFLAHYLKKSTAHFVDAAWRRGWVGN